MLSGAYGSAGRTTVGGASRALSRARDDIGAESRAGRPGLQPAAARRAENLFRAPEVLARSDAHRRYGGDGTGDDRPRSEEHTSELQSRSDLVCRLLLEKKKKRTDRQTHSVTTGENVSSGQQRALARDVPTRA